MLSFNPSDYSVPQVHQFMLGGIAPRPIALVSTISKDGIPNLSPFSFFNAFGANPPIVAFSPARRGRDGSLKDTYHNLMETNECVINAVSYGMTEQISLASCEYDSDVDEFVKAGFTQIPSDIVAPFRVSESPFQIECKLIQMIDLGGKGGSGNLAICEIVRFHIAEDIIVDGRIDPQVIDLVGRNGGDYYTRASGDAIFEVKKPGMLKGMGFDFLPDYILTSDIYTANNLGQFALAEHKPSFEDAKNFIENITIDKTFSPASFYRLEKISDYKQMLSCLLWQLNEGRAVPSSLFERVAKCALQFNQLDFAWNVAVFGAERK